MRNPKADTHFLANFYSKVPPTDLVDYPRQIQSLLSDAQHVGGLDPNSPANDYVNAAKVMLDRIHQAARLQERSTVVPAPEETKS